MIRDTDLLAEETSVETIVRRVQQRLRQRRRVSTLDVEEPVLEQDELEQFSNIHLAPDFFFQLDYAARIFDPRDTPGNTRFVFIKKAIQRDMRVYTTRQVEFNATVVRVLNKLFDVLHEIVEKFNYFRRAEVNLTRRMEYNETMVGNTLKMLHHQRQRIESVEGFSRDLYQHRTRLEALEEAERQLNRRVSGLEDLRNRLEHALAENAALRQRLEQALARVAPTPPPAAAGVPAAPADVAPALSAEQAHTQLLNDYLYFPYLNEDRSIEDVIRERVRHYLPFFSATTPPQPPGYLVDIGCGRGEFMDICRDANLPCKGIDINEDMVRHCGDKGHDVTQAGAVAYLQAQADASLRGIISCHVIEHMPAVEMLAFLRLCVRKLAPGGRLVLETPNPKSIFGLSMFYRDFTHEKPIHPQTMKFLLQELGMQRVDVEELHKAPEHLETAIAGNAVISANFRKLDAMVFGYLDYAVMAIR
jgi:2-polyprenyl-3-methyl-5-hydroxy-6-metoxy-1,4-benzoquinol methylase